MTPAPKVAVILLVHGDYAERYLADCMAGLDAQTYPQDLFSVFIVTNGVTEESRAVIARAAPRARLIHNASNLGWSGGNNAALRVALSEPFEHAVLLNVNVAAEPAWLSALVQAAEAHPELHILQSVILLHGTTTLNSAGNRIHYLGYGYCGGYGQERASLARGRVVDYASGASMLVKRAVFDAIGLFREEYFLYYDDLEFCWRARLAGYNVGLAEASVCHHKYDFRNTLRFLDCLQRNRLLTLLTLQKLRTIAMILPCLLANELVVGLYLVARGQGQAQWRALRSFLSADTWRTIGQRRREVGRLRTRTDAEVVGGFAGTIVFPELDHPLLRYVFNPLLGAYWGLMKTCLIW